MEKIQKQGEGTSMQCCCTKEENAQNFSGIPAEKFDAWIFTGGD